MRIPSAYKSVFRDVKLAIKNGKVSDSKTFEFLTNCLIMGVTTSAVSNTSVAVASSGMKRVVLLHALKKRKDNYSKTLIQKIDNKVSKLFYEAEAEPTTSTIDYVFDYAITPTHTGKILFEVVTKEIVVQSAIAKTYYENKSKKNLKKFSHYYNLEVEYHKNRVRTFSGQLRHAILERDNNKCVKCGRTAADSKLEIDHIVEYEDGGCTSFLNGQTMCRECNVQKHVWKKKTQI